LKISNLCDHNSPTSQTDRQTDRQTTCDRNTALCTKVHRAVKRNTSIISTFCQQKPKARMNVTWFYVFSVTLFILSFKSSRLTLVIRNDLTFTFT